MILFGKKEGPAFLRDAAWLGGRRADVYLRLLATASLLGVVVLLANAVLQGRPHAIDFAAFWGAARLALQGHASLAYDASALRGAELAGAMLPAGSLYPFLYPPPFLLVLLPFGLLAYLPALWLFVGSGYALLTACLLRILPAPETRFAILAFPGGLINLGNGQMGCLAAWCFAGAMLLLECRPFLAGLCLGGLVCKPQLAVCVPIALAAAGRWRALAGSALGAASLVLLSWAAFGTGAWDAFLQAGRHAGQTLTDPQASGRMQSVFAGLHLLGADATLSALGQGAAALAAVAFLVRVVRGRPGAGPEMSALVLASLLVSPYLFDYDLECLAVPLAWWFSRLLATRPLPWEKSLLLAAFLLPLLARVAGLRLGLPLTPPLLAALAAGLAWRLRPDRFMIAP